MQKNTQQKLLLFTAGGIFFIILVIFSTKIYVSQKNITSNNTITSLSQQHQSTIQTDTPIYITIPKIKIHAKIESVGLEKNGDMTAPKKLDEVVWFRFGPRPGETGNAVIAGHYGTKTGIVFNDLYLLKKGDDIYTKDTVGVVQHFIVRETQILNPSANADSVFNSNDNLPHLNLITCNGIWNKSKKTYSSRLVVFSDKVTEQQKPL